MTNMLRMIPILSYFLLSSIFECAAQEKIKVYYKLDSADVNYTKYISSYTSPYSKNQFTLNSFELKCNCHIAGYLSFSGHTNEDVGDTSEPTKVISKAAYKNLELISFSQLVELLKKHDLRFNDIYNLYLIEPCKEENKKYRIYNVKFRNSFIDSQ